MRNISILFTFLLLALPVFAQMNEDDPNTDSMTVEELRTAQLSGFDKICVSARCYQNNYAGSDIGECSTPSILPKGTYDPCNPTQTAEASESGNSFER